jgi:hypothetical protein
MGHTSVMRWNPRAQWVTSNETVHPPIIDVETFEATQALLHRRGSGPGHEHKQHRTQHLYAFKGSLYCGLCSRKMQGQRCNGEAYYRCRYAQEYALANIIEHPRNVYLRERDLIGPLDAALAQAFAPHRLANTITAMTDSQRELDLDHAAIRARHQLADCGTKLARHRAALEAGADPAIVTGWIAEVEAERRRLLAVLNQPISPPAPRMSRDQISELVGNLGDIIDALREADPADRAEVYRQLGLRLTYHPKQQKVRVQAQPDADQYGEMVRVRGGT